MLVDEDVEVLVVDVVVAEVVDEDPPLSVAPVAFAVRVATFS